MKKFIFCTLTLFVGLNPLVFGSCKIETKEQLLEKLKNQHPQISYYRESLKVLESNIEAAGQRPNPELEIEGMSGDGPEGDVKTASASILHTVELGSKHGSRVSVANAEKEKGRFSLQDKTENTLIDSILKTYRLRQIRELIPIYEEAYEAFNKILSKKKKRKSLSPEEQVEKETLVLATNDYRLKVSKLQSEELNIGRHLKLFVGGDCEILSSSLPSGVKLDINFESNSANNYSKLKTAKANLRLARERLELERSNSYPDLKIGPAYELEEVNGRKYHSFGIRLDMEIPILSLNSGAKAVSKASLERASRKLRYLEKESTLDIEAWIEKYKSLRNTLSTIASEKDLEEKHQRIEKLFKRGIISTAMVIESHRQLIEFVNTRFEFEVDAAEALWNVYKLKGTALQEKL